MKTAQILSVLLTTLFINAGLASAQTLSDDAVNGVKLRGDGTVDSTQAGATASSPSGLKLRGDGTVDDDQPGVAGDIGPNDTMEAKLAKLDRQRAKREMQRERALAGLAADDPKRAEINARFDRHLAKLDAKQARIEARGSDDNGIDAPGDTRREDRRADRQADRREDRQSDRRADRGDRPERAERIARVERVERAERPERAERVERVERVERAERPERVERVERSTKD